MDFQFFERLTEAEAEKYKDEVLDVGRRDLPHLAERAASEGVSADLSLDSTPALLRWLAAGTSAVPRSVDRSLPGWIRESESYKENLFDFDEPSKHLIHLGAYVLGESFVRAYPLLRWGGG